MRVYSLLVLSLCSGITACGGGSNKDKAAASQDSQEIVSIKAEMQSSDLGLAASPSAFLVAIDSCTSGFTASLSQASPSADLYKGDSQCLGKLQSFTVNGTAYSPSNPGATPFSNYTVGSSAIFSDSTGSSKLRVQVNSQLASPLLSSDTIAYAFSAMNNGGSSVVSKPLLGEAHSVSVAGDMAPSFSIDAVSFLGLNATGGGKFTFLLECSVSIVSGAGASCNGVPFSDLSYVLVEDTFSGAPSVNQLAAMFPGTSVSGASVTLATSQSRGGFLTGTLHGPDLLPSHPNVLLVIKNGASFQYFTVSAEVL